MPQVISAHNNKRLSISKVSLCLFQPIIGLLTFYQSFKIVQSTATYPSLEISLLRQVIGHSTAFLRGKSFLGSNSYWKKKESQEKSVNLVYMDSILLARWLVLARQHKYKWSSLICVHSTLTHLPSRPQEPATSRKNRMSCRKTKHCLSVARVLGYDAMAGQLTATTGI